MMQWSSLFSNERLGAENYQSSSDFVHRNEYLRDYDRLIFSSPFRRLQNKTQVFPLPKHIMVHNRLTHSLEVASVGRSLGQQVGEALLQKYPDSNSQFKEFYKYELQTVISTACLAHDIGNPPFGHSGEEAIKHYFRNLAEPIKGIFQEALTPQEQADFLYFEGNANTFRILTHPALGLHRMCYTTLASVVKYPCGSDIGFKKGNLATKKSGYFTAETEKYTTIAQAFTIPGSLEKGFARHPFVYLVEAADDICYGMIDLEDSFRLGIFTEEQIHELMLSVLPEGMQAKTKTSMAKMDLANQKLSYLRAIVINQLVGQCVDLFMLYEADLLAGNLNSSLLNLFPEDQQAAFKHIEKVSYQKIYNHHSVVERELAGYQVIKGLLEAFVPAVLQETSHKNEKLLVLIPQQFNIKSQNIYERLLAILDYVSGMTDNFATDLYKKLSGISV
jgi:dGTPase